MFLRTFRREDKRYLQQLYYETVHSLHTADYSAAQLAVLAPVEPDRERWAMLEAGFCFVVEYQRTAVGFICINTDGALYFLCVHRDYQGRGVATALLRQVERLARKKGIASLSAEVPQALRGFLMHKGFQYQGDAVAILHGVAIALVNMEKAVLILAV